VWLYRRGNLVDKQFWQRSIATRPERRPAALVDRLRAGERQHNSTNCTTLGRGVKRQRAWSPGVATKHGKRVTSNGAIGNLLISWPPFTMSLLPQSNTSKTKLLLDRAAPQEETRRASNFEWKLRNLNNPTPIAFLYSISQRVVKHLIISPTLCKIWSSSIFQWKLYFEEKQ
jgi:hypothetical protein